MSIKWKTKNIPHCWNISKSNRKIIETNWDKINTPRTHIYIYITTQFPGLVQAFDKNGQDYNGFMGPKLSSKWNDMVIQVFFTY